MQFKERDFPHPVLDPTNRDVSNSAFQALCTITDDVTSIYVDVQFDLSNSTLIKLIEQGKAQFVVHADCVGTFFRERYTFNTLEGKITLLHSEITRQVDLSFYICAAERLENYVISGMDSMYEGTTFRINKGDILAYSEERKIKVFEPDSMRKTSSIMAIVGDADITIPEIDYTDQKIVINLPEAQFEVYKDLQSTGRVRTVLISAFVMPALVHALTIVLSLMDSTEEADDKSLLWYSVLEQKIIDLQQKHAGIDGKNAYVLAHHILSGVNDKAFKEINSILELT